MVIHWQVICACMTSQYDIVHSMIETIRAPAKNAIACKNTEIRIAAVVRVYEDVHKSDARQ